MKPYAVSPPNDRFSGFPFTPAPLRRSPSQNGKLNATNIGGSIGRLPIHPLIMKYGDALFADLWAALDREKKSVAKMSAIEFHPQAVVLVPKADKKTLAGPLRGNPAKRQPNESLALRPIPSCGATGDR